MSHYTDIGFKIDNNDDIVDLFNQINTNKNYNQMVWDIQSPKDEGIILTLNKLGEIRYFSKLDKKNDEILDIGLAHNNENISKLGIIDVNYDNEGFPILKLEKDEIPFWFECPNVEIFDMENEKECDVKIACFANNVQVKKPNEKTKGFEDQKFQFADQAYMSKIMLQGDPATAYVSGVIKDYKVEKNIVSNNNYYAINAECLGLNIKMLVDIDLLDEKDLIPGNVICGEFWNTAILVADNHPDYF